MGIYKVVGILESETFFRIDEECFYFDGLLMLRWAKTFHDHHYYHDHHCASTLMPLVLYVRSVCVMFRPRLVTEYCYVSRERDWKGEA